MVCTGNEVGWAQNVWYCWDVPNWLTLVVEIVVAFVLGAIFFTKGNKYIKEVKISKKEKHDRAIYEIGVFTYLLNKSFDELQSTITELISNGHHNMSKEAWELFIDKNKLFLDEMAKLLSVYAESLEPREIQLCRTLNVEIQAVYNHGLPVVVQKIAKMKETLKEIAKFSNFHELKNKLGVDEK